MFQNVKKIPLKHIQLPLYQILIISIIIHYFLFSSMQDSFNQSPLVNFTMKMILEGEKQINTDSMVKIASILEDFVSGKIIMKECSLLLFPFIENMEPIERLNDILKLPDIPNNIAIHTNTRSKTRSWSFYEDQKLLAAIHKFGTNDWKNIAMYVGNRTKSQCSQRWYRCLDPRIKKEQWTKNQDDLLISLIAKNGTRNWTAISLDIGNRSDIQCRYRYKQLSKDPDFNERLAEAQKKLEKTVCNNQIELSPRNIETNNVKMMNSYGTISNMGNNECNNGTMNECNNAGNNGIPMNVLTNINTANNPNAQSADPLISGSYICLVNHNQQMPNFAQSNFVPILPMTAPIKPVLPLQFQQPMIQPPSQFPKMSQTQPNLPFQTPNQGQSPIHQPMLLYQQMPNSNLMNVQPSYIVYSSQSQGVPPQQQLCPNKV
ncbi:hypothetical protein TRFO_23819 [Tritrichomonas foetus]|uniref:Myb-like DNA-binding domain containing protein n=1 Tax=Tritrichomonas foetus TaxID=1144522 RepID=A0A1J4KDK1_9EUKA|nr:hypothetical protein TRFO_23819 [Tritrichomonas foetus]|eukprot:OHT07796.1 hypothetical protein TRFO_23819 [Tritrichomonas foetus]